MRLREVEEPVVEVVQHTKSESKGLIVRHSCHKLFDAVPAFEARVMQPGVLFLLAVRLHTLFLYRIERSKILRG